LQLKKLLSLVLLLVLGISLAACTELSSLIETTTEAVETTDTNTTTTEVVTTEESSTTEVVTTVDHDPVFSGVTDITIDIGGVVSFDEITVNDIEDGDITDQMVIDQSELDVNTEGEYTITLSVTDSYGNEVTVDFTVTVYHELTPEDKANAAMDAIVLDYVEGEVLDLPKYDPNGTFLYWRSSNAHVVTSSGFVIKPHVGSEDVDVVLTCMAKNSGQIFTRDFIVTIPAYEESVVYKHITLPFYGTSEEYVVEDQAAVDVFFVDYGSVPYIDVETFINLIDGALESSIVSFTPVGEDGLLIEYTIEYLDFDEVTLITENYSAFIDFTLNTFTVNSFDFFEAYVASTTSDYGSGLIYTGADYVEGDEVTIPLGEYNFDLVVYEDGGETYYLLPFHVANLLFAGGVYYDVYYNGDSLYGIDTFSMSSSDTADEELKEMIRTSSFNSKSMNDGMKFATYNFMALAFDYFYGLKEFKGVETYYDILDAKVENWVENDDSNLYSKLFDFAYDRDDLHTWHEFAGYYNSPSTMGLSINDLGPLSQAYYYYYWDIQDKLDIKYGSADNMPAYELLDSDTVAVIHLTGFTIDTPDEFKAILDGLPTSVIDVVIDISYNGGGNLGAVLRIFGYMTEEPFTYHSMNPADNSAVTYYIESEYVAYDYNWYVLTSGVTFSAANLFASMAKELGIPVIGQDSSGGASSIGVIISPDGTAFFISTNNVLCTRVGDEINGYDYISIENGIEVDYGMSDVTSNSQLISTIAEVKADIG